MSSTFGFAIILVIYLTIGILAVVGTITLSQRFLRPQAEQIFYAAFLVAIAGFYLAFNAYFQTVGVWPTELMAVGFFFPVRASGRPLSDSTDARIPLAWTMGCAPRAQRPRRRWSRAHRDPTRLRCALPDLRPGRRHLLLPAAPSVERGLEELMSERSTLGWTVRPVVHRPGAFGALRRCAARSPAMQRCRALSVLAGRQKSLLRERPPAGACQCSQ